MYYEAGHDHLNLDEFETRFVMQIFRFYCPASWSGDLMLVMYCRVYCMEAFSQVTRKELIINDTGSDPFRYFNQGYLLIQIKISQMEKSILMILMFSVKYIYWHFLLAKWPLKWVKILWQLSYFSIYTVADWSIDLYLSTQMYQSSLYLCLHIATRVRLIPFSQSDVTNSRWYKFL